VRESLRAKVLVSAAAAAVDSSHDQHAAAPASPPMPPGAEAHADSTPGRASPISRVAAIALGSPRQGRTSAPSATDIVDSYDAFIRSAQVVVGAAADAQAPTPAPPKAARSAVRRVFSHQRTRPVLTRRHTERRMAVAPLGVCQGPGFKARQEEDKEKEGKAGASSGQEALEGRLSAHCTTCDNTGMNVNKGQSTTVIQTVRQTRQEQASLLCDSVCVYCRSVY
jgi:hypothetical protein